MSLVRSIAVKRTVCGAALVSLCVSLGCTHSASSDTQLDTPTAVAARLPLDQLVGQRLIVGFAGKAAPRTLIRMVRAGRVAGVVLFSRNVGTTAQLDRLIASLQAVHRPAALTDPLLVMVDQEGGPVRRLDGPPRRSAAELQTESSALAAGLQAGRLLEHVGINVDLAPVADIARAGSAIEREHRSFGRSAPAVSLLAGAFARGLRAGGVVPTAKHFPGFGAAGANTDLRPVTIDLGLGDLRRMDEVPFRSIATRNPTMVMLSSAIYRRVDPRPAALSHRLATEELRGHLNFNGVSMSDAMETPALAAFGSPSRIAVSAASAGTDLLLFTRSLTAARRAAVALRDALVRKALRRSDFERSVARVLALRKSF